MGWIAMLLADSSAIIKKPVVLSKFEKGGVLARTTTAFLKILKRISTCLAPDRLTRIKVSDPERGKRSQFLGVI